jgi:hypothetical protein
MESHKRSPRQIETSPLLRRCAAQAPMIAGDKNFLKATLSRGWIVTQSKLIQLYTTVLQSTGTQAAFVAGCAFMGIAELRMPKSGAGWWTGENFLYDFFVHSALCLGVFASTQAALVMIYGPAISLKGEDGDCVILVATELRQQIMKIMLIGALAIACLYFALMANYWAKIPIDLAATTTIFFLFGIAVTISEGIRAYNIFHPGSEFSLSNLLSGETKKEDDRQLKYHKVLSGAYDDLPTGAATGGGGGGKSSTSPSGMRSIVKASGSDAQSDNSSELDPALIALIEERKKLQKVISTSPWICSLLCSSFPVATGCEHSSSRSVVVEAALGGRWSIDLQIRSLGPREVRSLRIRRGSTSSLFPPPS